MSLTFIINSIGACGLLWVHVALAVSEIENAQPPSDNEPCQTELSEVPDAAIQNIMNRLDPRNLVQLAATSKSFWSLASETPQWTYMKMFDAKSATDDSDELLAQIGERIQDCPGLQRPSEFLTYQQIALAYDRLITPEMTPTQYNRLPELIRCLKLPELFLFALCDTQTILWLSPNAGSQMHDLVLNTRPLCQAAKVIQLDHTPMHFPPELRRLLEKYRAKIDYTPPLLLRQPVATIQSAYRPPYNRFFPFNFTATRYIIVSLIDRAGDPNHLLSYPEHLVNLIRIGIRFYVNDIARLNLNVDHPNLPHLFGLAKPIKVRLTPRWFKQVPLKDRYERKELKHYDKQFQECYMYILVLCRVPTFVSFLRRNPDQLYATAAIFVLDSRWELLRSLAQHPIMQYREFHQLARDLVEVIPA